MKFSAVLLFARDSGSPSPISRWRTWCGTWAGPDAYTDAAAAEAAGATAGYLFQHGALDFAGGTVVHINAAVAGLVGAFMVGKRVGYGRDPMDPHSLTMTMIGAALLWFGWFGFNAGSPSKPTARLPWPSPTPGSHRPLPPLLTFAEWMMKAVLPAWRCVRCGGGPGRHHLPPALSSCGGRPHHRPAQRCGWFCGRARSQAPAGGR